MKLPIIAASISGLILSDVRINVKNPSVLADPGSCPKPASPVHILATRNKLS